MAQEIDWPDPTAAYLHVPFCAHHCGYCDFAIAVGRDDRIDSYLDALVAELATLRARATRVRMRRGAAVSCR